MSRERPILFSGPMVRSVLEGRKTQTRRVVKMSDGALADDGDIPCHDPNDPEFPIPAPDYVMDFAKTFPMWRRRDCPFGKPGDRLWVRETCIISPPHFCDRDTDLYNVADRDGNGRICQYIATSPDTDTPVKDYKIKVTPSIHMPRWASRILLEVVSVRVERLTEISHSDAIAEGVERGDGSWDTSGPQAYHRDTSAFYVPASAVRHNAPKHAFRHLWESINGPGSWDANPWVWVVEFRRLSPTS